MKSKMTNRNKTFWIIAILVIALFFTFNTLPMIKGVIYSFTNYKGYGSYDVVGWRNYVDLFTDARVGKSYLFTFKYAIAGTILVNVLSLLLALGLNSNIKGKSALRGIYFVPNILGVTGGRLYFQLYLYIHSSCHRKRLPHLFPGKQYSCQRKICMDCGTDRGCMAGRGHEYHHLYFGITDCSGRCL